MEFPTQLCKIGSRPSVPKGVRTVSLTRLLGARHTRSLPTGLADGLLPDAVLMMMFRRTLRHGEGCQSQKGVGSNDLSFAVFNSDGDVRDQVRSGKSRRRTGGHLASLVLLNGRS